MGSPIAFPSRDGNDDRRCFPVLCGPPYGHDKPTLDHGTTGPLNWTFSPLSPLLGVCDMESAIIAIITVFHKYSGNKSKLKKAELKHLINNEMSHFIMKIDDNDTLDRLFADLDQNGDLEIDFQEFISLIAMVTSACHDLIPL
ncbi:Protein S100-B [Merluccius polli]|uniref:Protein S100-B n=1 Tax=Merluccius polli TaxID=89951 RepID=A0AA47MNF2_MERPO|nr:Protein S100-B [Merluccius polli]